MSVEPTNSRPITFLETADGEWTNHETGVKITRYGEGFRAWRPADVTSGYIGICQETSSRDRAEAAAIRHIRLVARYEIAEAYTEALAEDRRFRKTTKTLTTPERNRLARIASIDEQITELLARRAALLDPPFKVGDRVVTADEPQTVWMVSGYDPIDLRLVSLCAGTRDRFNVPASDLRPVEVAR